MNENKYWLITSTTRDGEFEYSHKDTYYGKESDIENFIQKWRGFEDSYQIVELEGYGEIPEEDYKILKKYGI